MTAPRRQPVAHCCELASRASALEAENARLRAFSLRIMEHWPSGDVDGGDLQEIAIDCGLLELKSPSPVEPCGEGCACAEYYAADEFAQGVECYRRTLLLTGASHGKEKEA